MKGKMTLSKSFMFMTLHQIGETKVSDIIQNKKKHPRFAKFSLSTVYRHARKPLDGSQHKPIQ